MEIAYQNTHLLNKLAIQCSLDEFTYVVLESGSHNILSYDQKIFNPKIENPAALLTAVKEIFSLEPLLQQAYAEIILIHQNEWCTVVPNDFFNENHLKDYLKYSVKVFDNDFIAYDDLKILQAKNVYIPFVNINNFIFENFGEFTYLHASSVFLKNLWATDAFTTPSMHVQVFNNQLHVVVGKQQTLLLSNQFEYQSKEDFAYYLLFVAEQLQLDCNLINLHLYGNLDENSELYQLIYLYVRNITLHSNLQQQTVITHHLKNLFS